MPDALLQRAKGSVPDLVAVKVNAGLVVWHTREEYERLIRGVDMEAARLAPASVPITIEEPA